MKKRIKYYKTHSINKKIFDNNIVNDNMINNIANSITNRKISNVTKNILIQHSFNKVYNSNILNKRKAKVIQHLLTSNFIFDLSCGNTFKLKKNIIRGAFQSSFCRGLSPFSNKSSFSLINKVKMQTVQLALNCAHTPIQPFKKSFLQEHIPKTFQTSQSPKWLSLKTKRRIVPCFFGKRTDSDFLTFDSRLNCLYAFNKQKEKLILGKRKTPKKLAFFNQNHSLAFIQVISQVFNKAIKKSCLFTLRKEIIKTAKENKFIQLLKTDKIRDNSVNFFTSFKKSKKAFFSSNILVSSAAINITKNITKNTTRPKFKITDNKYIQNQSTEIRKGFTISENSRHLAYKKCKLRGTREINWLVNNLGEGFDGSLVRAEWVLNRFINQLSKKKMNVRGALNQQINDIRVLMNKMGSECPIKGMRIKITGRLGSRKKAMAQQISKCVGKVPLSTFRERVDYAQEVLPTRFGLVGIKIWICYADPIF